MKKLDMLLVSKISKVLEHSNKNGSAPARNHHAISESLLKDFYGKNPDYYMKSQCDAVLPLGLGEELKNIIAQDYHRLYISMAMLVTLGLLTLVEFMLLSVASIFIIPMLVTGNIGLILLGYIASEYKQILQIERDHDVCIQNKLVIDAFYTYLQQYKINDDSISQEDISELITMVYNLKQQAKTNGYD